MNSIKTSIVQWNARGIRNKKSEILQLISQYNVQVLALQETQMPKRYYYRIPKYNMLGKDGTLNRRNHGGVAIYIHQDIPYSEVNLTTDIQAVAATIHLKTKFTICNIYSSRSHPLTITNLTELFNQLPQPCMLLGDFNAYSLMWGCN